MLTDRGACFLDAVREAMRWIDTACEEMQTDALRGTFRIASSGVATASLVLPALAAIRARNPELDPEISSDLSDLPARLSSGRLDLALVTGVVRAPRLRCEKVGDVATAVYCGPSHPISAREDVSLADLEALEFVVPPPDGEGAIRDGWPLDRPRRVAMVVDQIRLGAEACLVAPVLAVLPVTVGERFRPLGLIRLPISDLPPTPLYAWSRRRLGKTTVADRVLESIIDSHRADDGGQSGSRGE